MGGCGVGGGCSRAARAEFPRWAFADRGSDIEAAHAELTELGIAVSPVFRDAGGVFHHAGAENRVNGPDPDHSDYASFVSFSDPDGNGWLLQEIRVRAPGR